MINVESIVHSNLPQLASKPWLHRPVCSVLKRLLHEQDFVQFAERYPHLQGIEFVEQVLEYFGFSYAVAANERERIPASGRLVIVANHPIGSLDGLALLKLVNDVRPDVKVVANQLLMAVPPLRNMLLPVNNMQGGTGKKRLAAIEQHLQQEGAVIIFPAGEVSRLQANGVKDGDWRAGFLRIAEQTQSPILPVFVQGRNSWLFYTTSMLYKPLSTLLLVQEMFGQRNKQLTVKIGDAIPYEYYNLPQLNIKTRVKLFRKHLYKIAKGKTGLYRTQTAIAHPEPRAELKAAISQCQALGQTQDGKLIYLYQYQGSSPILREIGRLREVAFRAVGEGTGQRRDIDNYDTYYDHLILWDDSDLEIVGAYRLGDTQRIVDKIGKSGMYSNSLFNYDDNMNQFFAEGLELGRSFVQPKYWGRRSLDYLWFGIGAYLKQRPHFRYLFGPVSLSNTMPKAGKDLMVYFYQLYFGGASELAQSNNPYKIEPALQQTLRSTFSGNNYLEDFTQLKHLLANMGASVPTLYKQYTELCEPGGVQFLAFGIDPAFNDCVDGLVLLDLTKLKANKRERYIDIHNELELQIPSLTS